MSGSYYLYRGDKPLDAIDSFHSGSYTLEHSKLRSGPDIVYIDDGLSGGDYGNDGGLARVNVDAFTEEHADAQGQLWWATYGDASSFGIAILADVLDEDSALYSSEDEDLVAAATSIKETLDALENYPLLDDEAHSRLEMELQEAQFPEAMMDVWAYDENRKGFRTSLPLMVLAVLEDDLSPEDVLRFVDADSDPHDAYPIAGFQAFYHQLGGAVFSVYPYNEGGGNNVSVVFNFDDLMKQFGEAYAAIKEVAPEAAPGVAHRIVEALFAEDWKAFEYGAPLVQALREGRNLDHMMRFDKPKFAVLQDAALADPARAAALLAQGKLIETLHSKGALSGYAGSKDPAEMAAAAINKELDKLSDKLSALNAEFIEAGRGHETYSETYRLTDPLAMRYRELHDRRGALTNEVERRAGPGMRRLPKGFGPLSRG